jgi:hypothetical protein
MEHTEPGNGEQEDIVLAEHHFLPLRRRSGHEPGEPILNDEDQPNQPGRMGMPQETVAPRNRIRIFRVPTSTLNRERVFEGRADEDEYLIEGTVENVQFSEDPVEEDNGD